MGKHERKEVEQAEKIIVKILNNEILNNEDRKNRWFNHAETIAKKIKEDFADIRKASHLGNRYDNTGDVLIKVGSQKFFIEIKMSEKKTGIGTRANISQDALTLNYLFEMSTKSWSKFRKELKHEEWVNDYLNQYKKYPKKILKIKNFFVQKDEKARYLRKIKEKDRKAKEILNFIHKKDKEEKSIYLNYLSKQKQNNEMIKRFTALVLLGIHKQEILGQLIKNNILFEEIKNLFVYYSNLSESRVVVRKENLGEKIKILNNFSNFQIIFPKDVTYCKIVGAKDKKETPFLQIVFHWKNIAQGIKTPCLNIFDLTRI
jgi:hypothetical protein